MITCKPYYIANLMIVYFTLGDAALSAQTTGNLIAELANTPIVSTANTRKERLMLFDLHRFDESFEIEKNILEQMNQRNTIWRIPYLHKKIEEYVMTYPPNQNKLVSYMPYYLSEILNIKSAVDLKHTEDFFSDFQALFQVASKALKSYQLKKMNEEFFKADLEKSPLYDIFIRYLALESDTTSLYPTCMTKRIMSVHLEEEYHKKDYKKLKEKYKKDKEALKKISNIESTDIEYIKQLISLHNFVNQ